MCFRQWQVIIQDTGTTLSASQNTEKSYRAVVKPPISTDTPTTAQTTFAAWHHQSVRVVLLPHDPFGKCGGN